MGHDLRIPVETLAGQAPPEVTLTREDLDAVAKLAMMLAQEDRRRADPFDSTTRERYESLDEGARARMRGGVVRVIQALHLTGWMVAPE